jgi:FtsP/CotA-like multicopper oxidase with cupredoxin domain
VPVRNRALLLTGLGLTAAGLIGLTATCGGLLGGPAGFGSAHPYQEPWKQYSGGAVREFKLTVARGAWELAPGKTVDAYTFNGAVPGPELRVSEGDTVRVTVTNQLQEPTTVHWHGVEVPSGMDGVPELSQKPIPAGASFTYEFVATPAGTRWYHAHFDETVQQAGGLVGALVIEPRQAVVPRADRDYVVLTQDWGPIPADHHASGGSMSGMMGSGSGSRTITAYSINGKSSSRSLPLVVRQGERVHLRLINAGGTETQVLGLAGHKLTLTHTDGNPLAHPVPTDAVPLGVGERADVEFTANSPGRWRLRGMVPGQAERGLSVDVVYQGHEGDPAQDFDQAAGLHLLSYADLRGPAHSSSPDRTLDLTLSGGMMMAGSDTWTINGKSYPHTDHIDVRPGQRVRLQLLNMSMEDHPMHLHGHTFQLVAIGDQRVDGPLKDTLTLHHMERYEIEFTANNPGVWLFHCHNLVHMHGGLMAEVHYV